MSKIEFVTRPVARKRVKKAMKTWGITAPKLRYEVLSDGSVHSTYNGQYWGFSATEIEYELRRVLLGADLLDRKVPGWEGVLQLDRLDISDCEVCVCGQLAHAVKASTPEGVEIVDLLASQDKNPFTVFLQEVLAPAYDRPARYGFSGSVQTEIAWHIVLKERRAVK